MTRADRDRTASVNPKCRRSHETIVGLKIKYTLTSTFAVELRGLEPLTSSMPSTVGLCGGWAVRLAIGHPSPALTAIERADW
jgi:hypothetical protein